jgi:CTP:molybdopterin cytidylyltransferase MocA
MLASIILSGGASRRMGTPKALLPYEGRTFLEHLLQVTNHPQIGVRRVVLGAGAQGIAESISLRPEEIIVNGGWEKGQLSSLHAALRTLPAGTDGMLVCLIDHPLISRDLVRDLIERFYSSRQPIVLPVYKSRRGHPVIFSSALYEELLTTSLETGARAVVWAHREEVSELHTTEEGCVLNLNDPDALAAAREKAKPI